MALRDLSLAFPLDYEWNGRSLGLNTFFPTENISHGDLRVIENLVSTDWSALENDLISLLEERASGKELVMTSPEMTTLFAKALKADAHTRPVTSTMGVSFPVANNVLLLDNRRHLSSSPEMDAKIRAKAKQLREEELQSLGTLPTSTAKQTQTGGGVRGFAVGQTEFTGDIQYQRHDPECKDYVFQLDGFYITGRRGTHPCPVLKMLRAPYQRTVFEHTLWKRQHSISGQGVSDIICPQKFPLSFERQWLKEMTMARRIPQYLVQVAPHARPLSLVQTKYHPDLPFVADPDVQDEYPFHWISFKPLEHFFQIPTDFLFQQALAPPRSPSASGGKAFRSGGGVLPEPESEWEEAGQMEENEDERDSGESWPEEKEKGGDQKIRFSFKFSNKFAQSAKFATATTTRRVEKKLNMYFAVSPEWDRRCVFDKTRPESYILHKPLADHYQETLGYSLPQEAVFTMILMNANSAMALKRESAKRGKTNEVTLLKSWRTWQMEHSTLPILG